MNALLSIYFGDIHITALKEMQALDITEGRRRKNHATINHNFMIPKILILISFFIEIGINNIHLKFINCVCNLNLFYC